MKSTPSNDFGIVYDTERKMVIFAGNLSECHTQREWANRHYQSTAYVVRNFNGEER